MSVTRTCPTCGFTRPYTSPALAAYHYPLHSCSKHLHQADVAHRRAQRAQAGPTGNCRHPRTHHVHGTRAAYVRDGCRCAQCRAANTAASNARHRERTFGRWHPLIDATAAREHIQALRAAGIGLDQIAKLAGVSASHVRRLLYHRRDDQQPIQRVRPETAERLLRVDVSAANRAPRNRIDATGTRRRLQALVAIGWTPSRLAAEMARSTTNLKRSMTSASVTATTAQQVSDLYERLWDVWPPNATSAQRAAIDTSRTYALQHRWLPPLDWDDIDADPHRPGDIQLDDAPDEIAIERAIAGDGIRMEHLTAAEQDEVVRRLTQRGRSIRDIADQLSTTKRTVSSRRGSVFAA